MNEHYSKEAILRKSILLLICTLVTIAIESSGQELESKPVLPAHKNWPVAMVYDRKGYDTLPVQVTIVSPAGGQELLKRGIFIRQVGIKNSSGRAVTAVKLSWYFYRWEEPDDILQTGQTPLIKLGRIDNDEKCDIGIIPLDVLPGRFAGAKQCIIDSPILSYAEIEEVMKKGQKSGRGIVEVVVSEVHFEDGMIWEGTDLPQKRR
jgi:hypothetical protein